MAHGALQVTSITEWVLFAIIMGWVLAAVIYETWIR
jgi:hypothetical protein